MGRRAATQYTPQDLLLFSPQNLSFSASHSSHKFQNIKIFFLKKEMVLLCGQSPYTLDTTFHTLLSVWSGPTSPCSNNIRGIFHGPPVILSQSCQSRHQKHEGFHPYSPRTPCHFQPVMPVTASKTSRESSIFSMDPLSFSASHASHKFLKMLMWLAWLAETERGLWL